MPFRTFCVMGSAAVAIARSGRPVVREDVWNWDLIVVLIACLLFWSVVIIGVVALV